MLIEDSDEMGTMPTEESAIVIREDTVTEKAINDEQDKTTTMQNMALAVTLNVNMIHEDLDEMENVPTEESAIVITENTVKEKAINSEHDKTTMVQNMALAVTLNVNMLHEDLDLMENVPTEESAIVIREDAVKEKAINDEQDKTTTVQNMALAMTSTVMIPHEDLDEMETKLVEESAIFIREDAVKEKAINNEHPEQICKAQRQEILSDCEDKENVKPMDTIVINFQENVDIEQTCEDEAHWSSNEVYGSNGDGTRSSLSVEVVHSFQRPVEENVDINSFVGQEECKDFFNYENSKTRSSIQIEFENESSAVSLNIINEMAQGKENFCSGYSFNIRLLCLSSTVDTKCLVIAVSQ